MKALSYLKPRMTKLIGTKTKEPSHQHINRKKLAVWDWICSFKSPSSVAGSVPFPKSIKQMKPEYIYNSICLHIIVEYNGICLIYILCSNWFHWESISPCSPSYLYYCSKMSKLSKYNLCLYTYNCIYNNIWVFIPEMSNYWQKKWHKSLGTLAFWFND